MLVSSVPGIKLKSTGSVEIRFVRGDFFLRTVIAVIVSFIYQDFLVKKLISPEIEMRMFLLK